MSYPMYQSTEATIKFADMAGVEWDDPKWDEFLNQMTYDELCTLIEFNGYGTPGVDSIEKTLSIDEDGPNNIGSSHCWPSEDLIASTWNVELAAKEGIIMANLALLIGDNGWYGPGMDTHRSPFSGRNNEYYSQDGIQGGYIAAAVVDAAESRGVVCYVKHCLLNDQETDRGVLFVWTTEQALRENYAKVFQMALQEGGSSAAMTGYAREGGFANTSNYNLNTRLYIDQWDVHAYFVTDGYIGWQDNADPDIMVRSGFQTELYTDPYVEYLSGEWDAEKNTVMVGPEGNKTESYTQWYGVRQAAKSVLYMQATSSGNLNGYTGLVIEGGMLMPGTQAVDYSASVSIADKLTPGSTATYSVDGFGGLPMGLTLDANTGEISGTPIESGEFMLTVNVLIDGFIEKTGSYMLNIEPAFTMDENGDALDSAKVGSDFMARITSKEFTTEKYETVEYKVVNGALPAGLELAPDGTISGTPTESGIFNVTVNMTATEKSAAADDNGSGGDSGGSGGDSSSNDKTFDYDMTIVVADAEGNSPAAPIEEGADNTAVLNDLNTRVAALEGKKTSGGSNALGIIALIVGVLGLGGACYGIISGLKGKKSK